MLESDFQAKLIKKIPELLDGAEVLKMDANYRQGWPDLLVLHQDRFALLEVKASGNEPYRPNQEYYLNDWKAKGAFTETIFPENEEEVLMALRNHFLWR